MKTKRPCSNCGQKEKNTTKKPRNKFRHVIKENKVMCKKCGDIIESKHRHDFVCCSCDSVCVDGGHDYTRRLYKDDDCYIELSVVVKERINV